MRHLPDEAPGVPDQPTGLRRPELLSGFVILSLVAVLLTPIVIQRRVHDMRDEIEHAADPARTLVTQIQYLLARQTSTLRGYFITGDESFLTNFEALAAREATVYAELGRHVDRLGGPVVDPFAELRTLAREWHERLDREEIEPRRESAGAGFELSFDAPLYLDALAAAGRLDQALVEATRARRREIERAERRGLAINVVLALLAIAASVTVANLSRWHRRVAREAEDGRTRAEEALREKVEATEARDRLLRGVTHDVKNPLGAADAYAELLEIGLRGPLRPEQTEFVGKIRSSIHSALSIIRDLLEVGAAESGHLEISRVPTEIGRVVVEAAEEQRAAAVRAGHTLRIAIDPDLPALLTDPARVLQVLANLLSNAIKYTPSPGTVRVSAGVATDDEAPRPGKWIAIRVIDSGPGIPPERREAIFEEFGRLHAGLVEGNGLGLTIARRIARLLDGDVAVGGAPGGGAEFVLWLPVDVRPAGAWHGVSRSGSGL